MGFSRLQLLLLVSPFSVFLLRASLRAMWLTLVTPYVMLQSNDANGEVDMKYLLLPKTGQKSEYMSEETHGMHPCGDVFTQTPGRQ
jgi:hypothetical protein